MTRINLLPPHKLHDKHLLAEYRELPRVFGYVKRYGVPKDIPERYTLGKGHVKFFANKLDFLFERYVWIWIELEERSYNLNYHPQKLYDSYEKELLGDEQVVWRPDKEEIRISEERIKERLREMKNGTERTSRGKAQRHVED